MHLLLLYTPTSDLTPSHVCKQRLSTLRCRRHASSNGALAEAKVVRPRNKPQRKATERKSSPSSADVGPANSEGSARRRAKRKIRKSIMTCSFASPYPTLCGLADTSTTICARAEALPKSRPQTHNGKDGRDTRHKTHDSTTVQREQLCHCGQRTTTRRATDAG